MFLTFHVFTFQNNQMVSFRFLSKYDPNKRQPKLFIEPSNISKKHYFSLFKQVLE
ncbi:hypothetical protein HanXRQr2_Chr01g0028211 [Helianthus annuus]|uniref:Uncharacterized protein n=1 Tax=Helianthus annuus TaxID=4232 RepID=A0A9K3P2R6_HELAN|nr:hypothetical protein HanXRQr2_Chr01g0028211 [Helianthus annuus]